MKRTLGVVALASGIAAATLGQTVPPPSAARSMLAMNRQYEPNPASG